MAGSFTLSERYVLETTIAGGGMATVWRARDEVLARVVAIKMLHGHLAADPEFLARFRHEALAAARLSHRHIVRIFDTGVGAVPDGAERPFIVMEYCAGGSLADALRSGPMDPAGAAAIAAQVCNALAFAHAAGVIHRDIKPANVLLSSDGAVKVADFGIAKAAFVTGDITTTGSILGTVTYLSPEQLTGLEPDARSDVYSVGVLLFELLVGRPPFVADSQLAIALRHQREPPPSVRSLRAGVPRALDAIVSKALAKDPSDRFSSAQEMEAALQAATAPAPDAGDEVTAALAAHPARAPSEDAPTSRVPVVGVLVAVAIAVLAAFVVPGLLFRDDGNPTRTAPSPGGSGQRASVAEVAVRRAVDFDPYGGDGEHPEAVGLAVDGDPNTFWRTSTYDTSLEALGKPGVGLLLDLGGERSVRRVEVSSPSPGFAFELRAGAHLARDESGFEVVGNVDRAAASSRVDVDGFTARYWLVWITALPDSGGGRAEVSEVRFFGT